MSVAEESRGVTIIPNDGSRSLARGYDRLMALMADFVRRQVGVIATRGAICWSTGAALLVRDHQSSGDRNLRH
jgi:hypothetical protein